MRLIALNNSPWTLYFFSLFVLFLILISVLFNFLFFISTRMYDILCDLFAERMPQDKSYKYKPDTVNVYFENRIKATLHQVDVRKTIKEITTDKK